MLVLSRKKGETIHIGNDIVVTVTEIRNNRCRLGIDAPREISIDRKEVSEAKQREKANATGG